VKTVAAATATALNKTIGSMPVNYNKASWLKNIHTIVTNNVNTAKEISIRPLSNINVAPTNETIMSIGKRIFKTKSIIVP
jgi:hypothetical protein